MKLVVIAPRISGVSTTPDDVAEVPITPWTKSGTKLIVPNMAAPTSAMHATLEETVWLRSKSNGRIGFVDRKSTRLNSSHQIISYAVFCLKKKKKYKHN